MYANIALKYGSLSSRLKCLHISCEMVKLGVLAEVPETDCRIEAEQPTTAADKIFNRSSGQNALNFLICDLITFTII